MKRLTGKIKAEIEANGPITFARFMELALYSPGEGYYEKERRPGRAGDFYTSVSVGELFGQLLAFQFAEWLEGLGLAEEKAQIVEGGAHDGGLARDILAWLRAWRPALLARLEYWIIEPSMVRAGWQRETLKDFHSNVRWIPDFDAPARRFRGIIISNELLDAFPAHRLRWDAKGGKWREWGVSWRDGEFVHVPMNESATPPWLPTVAPELLAVLPDGYAMEISPAASQWWREAAASLERGKLLTIDYGLTEDERYLPHRKDGTLRAYFQHHPADNVLANVGEQDLTAHVNFSALQAAGESAGLTTDGLLTQSQFLTRILEKTVHGAFDEWTPGRARQFQTLTHPEHLGRAFRALIQARS
ncbi:MAG: class I SAM-dependent methyltransferase [Limisphaerales bacterium]